MGEVGKRTPEEIQREIARVRDRLLHDVTEMEVAVRDKLDWRRPIRQRPLVWVAGAFAIGLVIALK